MRLLFPYKKKKNEEEKCDKNILIGVFKTILLSLTAHNNNYSIKKLINCP